MSIRTKHNHKGFTLAELLMALMVASIVLTAVATLAYALGMTNDASDDTSQKQAQVRYATLRISELIRHCKLICGTADNDLAVWQADYNGDGTINPPELVYLEAEPSQNHLRLLEFPTTDNWPIPLSNILTGTAKQELILICDERQTELVPECSDVQFVLDSAVPWSKSVCVSFNLVENGVARQYQINAALRGWAGHLLDTDGDAIVSDDD